MEQRTSSYFRLTKPGITISNTLTAIAGFFLATSAGSFSVSILIGVVAGIALIIASACVANNVLDRDIDIRMKRTAKRGTANRSIRARNALSFAALLGLLGFTTLLLLTNLLTFALGVLAYVWYIAIYGIAKRTTEFSTIIGGVAGALPPMAGYVAVTGAVDVGALLLFLLLFFWQLPHFYAIAMFRRDDYKKASLPVWSVRYGMASTKRQIMISVIAYAVVASLLFVFGYTGVVYLAITLALAGYWVYKGLRLYNAVDDIKWARTMFGISLLTLLIMCVAIAVGGYVW